MKNQGLIWASKAGATSPEQARLILAAYKKIKADFKKGHPMTNEATTDKTHDPLCIGGNKGPCNCGATPPTDAQKALDALERLANTPMQLSLAEWQEICTPIRAALTRDNTEAIRVVREALEAKKVEPRGKAIKRYDMDYSYDLGWNAALQLAIEALGEK